MKKTPMGGIFQLMPLKKIGLNEKVEKSDNPTLWSIITSKKFTGYKSVNSMPIIYNHPPCHYPPGHPLEHTNQNNCYHCVWTERKGRTHGYAIKRIPRMNGYYKCNNNVCVFNNERFQYAIYLIATNHNMSCIMTLLHNTFDICDDLYYTTGIIKVHILMNYGYAKNREPEREHPHTWIVMRDKESQNLYDKYFNSTNGYPKYYKNIKCKNVLEPYGSEIIELTRPQLHKFKTYHTIDELFIDGNYKLTENNSSFYIFIEYEIRTHTIERVRISS